MWFIRLSANRSATRIFWSLKISGRQHHEYVGHAGGILRTRAAPGRRLYEDEGDTYNYEKGTFATIPMRWDNNSRMLTIGDRAGSFPGMQQQRAFHIVVVRPGHGTGIEPHSEPERSIRYDGKQQGVYFDTP